MTQRLIHRVGTYRSTSVLVLHMALVILSNFAAFWLRFDGAIPPDRIALWAEMLPVLMAVRSLTFGALRVYEGVWRYTSLWDLRNILAGVLLSTTVFYVVVHLGLGLLRYPRSIFVIDSLLLIFLLAGVRLSGRLYRELRQPQREKKVLVFGAGDAGEMIVRDMRTSNSHDYEPVGFIDDDGRKVGQRIHGIKVLGTRSDLSLIIAEKRPHELLIAIPRAEPAILRDIVKTLEPFKIPITTLPSLRDILGGRVTVREIRKMSVEDLLPRAPVGLDPERVRRVVSGRRVVVTGAGGSIGSELCRQIAALDPALLVLYERYENSLYAIGNELAERVGEQLFRLIVGDVTDAGRVEGVMADYAPQIVIHAAAHKHVPLMEANPCEAVKNNVGGSRIVAEAADRHGAAKFILISSDKAVNASGVMGATKRVAELLVQAMGRRSRTAFVAVRFGNVLGSNGSVVPRFLEQIEAGGPVTVTHPEVRRYFMLIPEAVQLVLHAAALGRGGETYVLEMGEQIRVAELARSLIRLAGFVPDQDIPVRYTGLRPGEKLAEELVEADETLEPSGIENIWRVRSAALPDPEDLWGEVAQLERVAEQNLASGVVEQLREIVPTFRSECTPSSAHVDG